ncbi:MAG: hypothetical protein RR449_03600 [Christensenella sp.]
MNNLGLLIQTYFRTSFGFNKAKYSHDKRAKSTGLTVVMVFSYVMIAGAVFGMSFGLMQSLKPIGAEYMVLNIMMMAASLTTLFTTIFKVNGTLFGFKDYDLQMALPIKISTLITSRILILYGLNILFVGGIMIPAGVAYAITVQPMAAFYPIFIVTLLAIPLLPIIIATIIGTLVAFAASRFKRKNGLTVIFSVVAFMAFMIIWMGFWSKSESIMIDFANISGMINDILLKVYPLTALYGAAVSGSNVVALLGFLLISFGAFAVFVLIVARVFNKINTSITTNRTASNYKMTALNEASPKRALYRKELKRYFSSSQYVLNTAAGPLLLIVASVVLLVGGTSVFGAYSEIPQFQALLNVAAPMGIALFLTISCTTAASVSLEGKNLWIVRSLPVDTRLILKSKLNVAFVLYYPTILICGTLFNIALKPNLLYIILMYLIPLAYGYFTALFGLKMNIANATFDWTNEITVIKQSKSILYTMLIGMLITIVPAIAALFFGQIVMLISLALITVVDILLYRNVMSKGVRQFESY